MSYSEDKFKEHIKQITKVGEHDSERALTLDELKELALSMGLTDSEWDNLLIKAEDQLTLGLSHLSVANYTDAIACAEEATAINPYIKDGNAILAQAYYKLALVDENADLFKKAEHYARMELKNDPLDSTALNVLGAVEQQNGELRSNTGKLKLVAIIGGALFILFIVLLMCSGPSSSNSEALDSSNSIMNVNAQKEIYFASIQRRNDLCLELVGLVQDDDLKDDFKEAIIDYDFDEIQDSENKLKLLIGEVRAANVLNQDDMTQLEGAQNRISTEKRRYILAVEEYNQAMENEGNGDKKIEINE